MKPNAQHSCRLVVEAMEDRVTPSVIPGPPGAFLGLDVAVAKLATVVGGPPGNAPVFALNYGDVNGLPQIPALNGLTTALGIVNPGPPGVSPIFFGLSHIAPQTGEQT